MVECGAEFSDLAGAAGVCGGAKATFLAREPVPAQRGAEKWVLGARYSLKFEQMKGQIGSAHRR